MIVYISTRLFCALYGVEWPLPEATRGFVATVSVAEFVAAAAFLVVGFVNWIAAKKKGCDHA